VGIENNNVRNFKDLRGMRRNATLLNKDRGHAKKFLLLPQSSLVFLDFAKFPLALIVHDHELMWAHYADQYRGICIAYSFAKLLDSLGDDVSFVRMYYNEIVPIVRHSRQEPADVAKMVLSYKNYRWLYEREWRMFAPLGKAPYDDKSCVTRLYLGSRIASGKRNKIIRAMSSLDIETYDMKIEKYSIVFEPCS